MKEWSNTIQTQSFALHSTYHYIYSNDYIAYLSKLLFNTFYIYLLYDYNNSVQSYFILMHIYTLLNNVFSIMTRQYTMHGSCYFVHAAINTFLCAYLPPLACHCHHPLILIPPWCFSLYLTAYLHSFDTYHALCKQSFCKHMHNLYNNA